jgi:hypothetical protein
MQPEQRVPAAGPTITDIMADMAFYFGLVEALATSALAPESQLPFATARANFYLAARHGLGAGVVWLDRKQISVRELLLKQLLPLARQGLEQLRVERALADRLLAVIEGRVLTMQNGASWQRRFLERHGREMEVLTREYRDRQRAGPPVHQWDV